MKSLYILAVALILSGCAASVAMQKAGGMGQLIDLKYDDGDIGAVLKESWVADADGSLNPSIKLGLIWASDSKDTVAITAKSGLISSSYIDSASIVVDGRRWMLESAPQDVASNSPQVFKAPLEVIKAIVNSETAEITLVSGGKNNVGDLKKDSAGNVVLKDGLNKFLERVAFHDRVWPVLIEGSDLTYDPAQDKDSPNQIQLSNGETLFNPRWNDYFKPIIESHSLAERGPLMNILTKSHSSYDEFEAGIRLYSNTLSSQSFIWPRGLVTKDKATFLIELNYGGDGWIFWDKFTLLVDGEKLEPIPLEVKRDNSGGSVWEYSFLTLDNRRHREMANSIASAKRALIRFHGKQSYSDFEINEEQKAAIRDLLSIYQVSGH